MTVRMGEGGWLFAARAPGNDEEWMARADEDMMRQAIAAAGRFHTHPNPRVGAVVITADGKLAGRGAHRAAGARHAEIVALEEAGERSTGATLYVTLEPCVHHGRTPPCSEAVIAAGVKRVVVAVEDPDPHVAGRGIRALRRAGLEVRVGVLAEDATALDPGYFHHRKTGRPRVTLKAAATLDGQIAAADGSSRWITCPEAREDGHRLRAEADAVMVGAGTVLTDNPRLTVRLEGYAGRQPVPVVVAGRRPLPVSAAVFDGPAIVLASRPLSLPADVLVVPGPAGRAVDLDKGLSILADRGIVDVLVEGGPRLAAGLLGTDLIDRAVFYVGARLAGGTGRAVFDAAFETIDAARSVDLVDVRRVGSDLRVEFTVGAD